MRNYSVISNRILSGSNTRAPARIVLLALLLLVLALYLPEYAWAFIGDDYVQFGYIQELVKAPGHFYRAFNPFWSTWYYRPLQNLWLLANRLLFGLNPFPYYTLQGLWHLLASVLLYALARRLHLSRGLALGVTALFALNSHHQDVAGWISSIATLMVTVFSFSAILAYLPRKHAAAGPRRGQRLALVALFTLLALLSHESGILLPPFLLLIALTRRRPAREVLLLAGLLLAAVALGAVHLLRPNLTLAVQETPLAAYFNPAQVGQFLAVVAGRWTLLTKTAWGTALLNRLLGGLGGLVLVALALAGAGWAVYRIGRETFVAHDAILRRRQARNMSTPLLLTWIGLQLSFVYGALWVQAPQLLAGRHLYAAWAGVALALGLATQSGLARWRETAGPRRSGARSRPTSERQAMVPALLLATCLLAFLLAQITFTREAEASWLAHAEEVAAVEAQLKEQLPALTPETAIYARNFVLTPAFAPYAVAVWYGETGVAGGSVARLQAAGALGPESYLFDYEDGQLRELLPALHEYAASFLLWPEEPTVGVAGPQEAERLALPVAGAGWQTVAVATTVRNETGFYTAFYGPAGSRYRVRAVAEAKESVLATGTVSAGTNGWKEIAVALPRYSGLETTFLLEAAPAAGGSAAWALPRLARE